MVARMGVTREKREGVEPTVKVRVPRLAPLGPPETGRRENGRGERR